MTTRIGHSSNGDAQVLTRQQQNVLCATVMFGSRAWALRRYLDMAGGCPAEAARKIDAMRRRAREMFPGADDG